MRDTDLANITDDELEEGDIETIRVAFTDEIIFAINDLRKGERNWTFEDAVRFLQEAAGLSLYVEHFKARFYDHEDPALDVAQDLCEANAIPEDFKVGETIEDTLERGVLRDTIIDLLETVVSNVRTARSDPQRMFIFARDALQISTEAILQRLQLYCADQDIDARTVAEIIWEDNIDSDFLYEQMAIGNFAMIYRGTDSDDQMPTWTGSLEEAPFCCVEACLSAVASTINMYKTGQIPVEKAEMFLRRRLDDKSAGLQHIRPKLENPDISAEELSMILWAEVGLPEHKEAILHKWNKLNIELKVRDRMIALQNQGQTTREIMAKEYEHGDDGTALPKHGSKEPKAPAKAPKQVSKAPKKRSMRLIAQKVEDKQLALPEATEQLENLVESEDPRVLWKKMYECGVDPVYFYEQDISEATGIRASSRHPISRQFKNNRPFKGQNSASYSSSPSEQSEDAEGWSEGLWGLRMPTERAKTLAKQLNLADVHVDYHDKKLKSKRKQMQVKRLIMGDKHLDTSNARRRMALKREASSEGGSTLPKRLKLTFKRAEALEAGKLSTEAEAGNGLSTLNQPLHPTAVSQLSSAVPLEAGTTERAGEDSGNIDAVNKMQEQQGSDLPGSIRTGASIHMLSGSPENDFPHALNETVHGADKQRIPFPPPSPRPARRELPPAVDSLEVDTQASSSQPPPSPRPQRMVLPSRPIPTSKVDAERSPDQDTKICEEVSSLLQPGIMSLPIHSIQSDGRSTFSDIPTQVIEEFEQDSEAPDSSMSPPTISASESKVTTSTPFNDRKKREDTPYL